MGEVLDRRETTAVILVSTDRPKETGSRESPELTELLQPWLEPWLLLERLLYPQWQTQCPPCLGPRGANSELGFVLPALAHSWQNQ